MKNFTILILFAALGILVLKLRSERVLAPEVEANASAATPLPVAAQIAITQPVALPNPSPTSAKQPDESIPPCPTQFFNDYARVTTWPYSQRIEKKLKDFEWGTSAQVIVAIYPRMLSDAPLEEYTKRIFNAWGVGQRDANNGVAIFVFTDDRRFRICVGRGLESVITNPIAEQIVNQMRPYFNRHDFDRGLNLGVNAILETIRPPTRQPTPVPRSTPGPHDRVARPPVFLDRNGNPIPMRSL